MSVTQKEIEQLADYLVNTLHNTRVAQQELDDKYRDDTFSCKYLDKSITQVRTGKGYRMVSAPAEHIITSNPQVFRDIRGKGEQQNKRVAIELNRWARLMLRQNPQPYKEFVKKLLGKGEAWAYWIHNNAFDPDDINSLPFQCIILEPTVVFQDPAKGENDGVPHRVIVSYQRIASNIKANYPDWAWTKRQGQKDNDKVNFMMYFDDDVRYFSAAGDPILMDSKGNPFNGDGIQPNVYKFCPFTHAYSGFGESTAEGDPASLAVGRLTKIHDLIEEYTAIRSVIDNLTYKYATPPLDLYYDPSVWTPPAGFGETYDRSPGAFNTVPMTANGKLVKGVDMLPDMQLFQYLGRIENDINNEDPLGTVGQAVGTSGRQEDMVQSASLRRYDTIVDNTAHSFATGFGLVLRMIEAIPSIQPKSIEDKDIGGFYDCRFELKAEDPIAQDRLRTLGSRLYEMGQIDLGTNLTKYQGFTQKEADDIIVNMMVELVTFKNPDIATVLGNKAAEEAGILDEVNAAKEQLKARQSQSQTMGITPPTPMTPQVQGTGETGTPTGREMIDMALANKGQRSSPRGYFRNQESALPPNGGA